MPLPLIRLIEALRAGYNMNAGGHGMELAYLEKYEAEGRPRFAVDIDQAIKLMDSSR